MMRTARFLSALALVLSALALPQAPSVQAQASPGLETALAPVKWRSIGPFRGGRSVAGTGVLGDPNTYYMGTTGGGLWKTTDRGISWKNITDGFVKTGSVGAVAVAPSDSNVVYLGMGEHAVRGVMTHHGDGVYRSTDAGRTWTHLGLADTQHIARIIVHPTNPDIAWVAAQGSLYGPGEERGIFKTTDGGATWRKVLYVDERTGASELSMDATNPRILYAATWEYGRLPWKVISGGPGSALYKSTDSGETWTKMTEGLPEKMGKMAIAVAPSSPDTVYALIESDSAEDDRGLYVSTNAGKSWSQVTSDPRLVQRAWYYIELFVDPQNAQKIYVLSAPFLRSDDGGKSWKVLSAPHGDYHDMWINPQNPDNFVLLNDGGASITFDGGSSWSAQDNMPTAQFYRINVDNRFPYRIYGAQQDNSSVVISSRELGSGSITERSWDASAGGESAFLAFDPDNPRFVMGGSYQGTIEIIDTEAGAGTNVMSAPIQYLGMDARDMKYRYNWNAPIIWSKHEPNTFYHGAQVLLKTSDLGRSWKEVSPDLTRNEKDKQGQGGGPFTNEAVGAENYGTLAYVVESPHEKGVIWTGSDDGLVHVTRDGGATWKNVTPQGLAECLVNAIEVSPHDRGTAYIATTRYKFNDHTPGLYKTTDYGATWTRIDAGIPRNAFTRVVREDQVRRDLLFAGTELGVFVSWNGGRDWQPFNLNLPLTPITDLRVHRDNLIAATSGRSFWVLDDLPLIRQYRASTTGFHVYEPAPAHLANGGSALNGSDPDFTGADTFEGVNPANGIVLYYQLPELGKDEELTLRIDDAQGNLVRTFSSKEVEGFKKWDGGPNAEPTLPKKEGLNRFVWNMRYPTMPGVPGVYIESSYAGHKASPGQYTFTFTAGSHKATTKAAILPNPLYQITDAQYREYHTVMSAMEREVTTMHEMVNQLHGMRERLEALIPKLKSDQKYAGVLRDAEALIERMKTWDADMVSRRSRAYDDVENFAQKFTANYMFMINATESDIPRVNQGTLDRLEDLGAGWITLRDTGNVLLNEVQSLNKRLWDLGVGAIWK